VNTWANWKCNDATGSNGYNDTYDFAHCGGTITASLPKCVWNGSTTPAITSPAGTAASNGTQAPANGKAWQVTWPTLTTSKPVLNEWVEMVMVKNSQPYRSGLSSDDSTQPFIASFTKGGSSVVVDTQNSGTGLDGWAQHTAFLQFFKASTVVPSAFTFGSETSNPVSLGSKAVNPFGVYLVYHWTYTYAVSTGVGGSTVMQVPGTCVTNMAYFYPVSGRSTK
jgi:hypothetical protein